MRISARCILFAIQCLALSAESAAQQKPANEPTPLVFTHVTVIDATGAPARPNVSVIVINGRIAAIQSTDTHIPKPATVVDGTGKFLIPGLWDMHVHLDSSDTLPLFIANGVTSVRVMWGFPEHHEWRKEIEAGNLLGPRMKIASPLIDGPHPVWRGSVSVTNETEARQAVAISKKYGADFIKVYQFLPRDLYFDIADEAKKENIPFEGHLPMTVTAEEASRAGQKSIEHLFDLLPAVSTRSEELFKAAQVEFAAIQTAPKFDELHDSASEREMLDTFSPAKAVALSAVFKKNDTWQCPTLVLLHMFAYGDDPAFLADSRLKYIPLSIKRGWNPADTDGGRTPQDFAFNRAEFEKYLQLVGIMARSGVGILAGTDAQNPYSFYGFSLHDELGLLVQAGLSPMQALQAATLNPAIFFGMEKDLGTIETGKIADLVLLDANPLEAIANTKKISAVVVGGKLYPREALDAMLAKDETLAARPLIGMVLYKTIQDKGIEAAAAQYRDLKLTQPDRYVFSENELIVLGYLLIHQKQYKNAIEIFKLSVESYPQSWNTYDSLAEAYMDNGDKELAIRNYQKSLEINPKNSNGIAMLKKLNAQ